MIININNYITIYPTKKGWIKIKELLTAHYKGNPYFNYDEHMKNHKTDDGGYKYQMWCMIEHIHPVFYDDSFMQTKIEIKI